MTASNENPDLRWADDSDLVAIQEMAHPIFFGMYLDVPAALAQAQMEFQSRLRANGINPESVLLTRTEGEWPRSMTLSIVEPYSQAEADEQWRSTHTRIVCPAWSLGDKTTMHHCEKHPHIFGQGWCPGLNEDGTRSHAGYPTTPEVEQPVGSVPCHHCGGTGKITLDDNTARNAIQRAIDESNEMGRSAYVRAITHYRHATNQGLREAKNSIDKHWPVGRPRH